ncbi:uncharacterized protein DS421_20g679680 [Arachis hypogaea]|nr:uncharacterized protein DS421_20g679680 [Arachis hypogaea]
MGYDVVCERKEIKLPTSEDKEESTMKVNSTVTEKAAETTDVDASLASGVAKGTNGGGRSSLEDNMLNVLTIIQKITLTVSYFILCQETNELMEDHGRTIQALIMLVNTANNGKLRTKGKKALYKCEATAWKTSGERQTYSSSDRKATAMTDIQNSQRQPYATGAEMKSVSLKRKLTFEDLDSSFSPGSNIRQTKPGTPFTYHTHHGHHVAAYLSRKCPFRVY